MSKELKITKERIKKLAGGLDNCRDAQQAVKDAFPEAFEEKKEEWVDVTEEIDWDLCKFCSNSYWLMGTFAGEERFYFNATGLHFNLEEYKEFYKIKIRGNGEFCIFEKK